MTQRAGRGRRSRWGAAAAAVLAAVGVGCLGVAATAQQAPPPQVGDVEELARLGEGVSQQTRDVPVPASAASSLPREVPPEELTSASGDAAEPAQARVESPAASVDSAPPERLRVPWLGVDTAVGRLGLDSEGALEVPRGADEVGWFEEGTTPGLRGAAVLTGHVDSQEGPGVFYHLALLPEGAEIFVEGADGSELVFEVRHVAAYPKDELPTARVYSSDRPTLRLVTCGGDWDDQAQSYRDNVVAYAQLVSTG